MSKPPITVDPDASVRAAARVMTQRKIGCLPVVENGGLLGLLTESDILGWVAGLASAGDARIPATRD